MNVEAFPLFIREKIRTSKVSVQAYDESIVLVPMEEAVLEEEQGKKVRYGHGCMKGEIWMSDDFDEPLEDFKEYM